MACLPVILFLFSFSLILVKFEEYVAWHRIVGGASENLMLDVFQRQQVAANLVKCELISGLKGNPRVDWILENQYQLKMSTCKKKKLK